MKQLTREDINQARDLEITPIDVPEWGGTVHLRVMPADEGLVVAAQMQGLPPDKRHDSMFMLLAATLCDADGKALFDSPDQLRPRSHKVLTRLQQESLRLQGWKDGGTAKNGSGEAVPAASPTA